MCIIIYRPKNKIVPLEDIENSFAFNSHGAGFCYKLKNSQIKIDKGFMNVETLKKELAKVPSDVDLLIHFRISTSGGIKAGNTHPFPITNNFKVMQELNCLTDSAVMHNGIISIDSTSKTVNDTMEYTSRVLYPLKEFNPFRMFPDVIKATCQSKLAYMDSDGVVLIGSFIEENGVYYSNTSYLPYVPKKPYTNYSKGYGYTYDGYSYNDDLYRVQEMVSVCEHELIGFDYITDEVGTIETIYDKVYTDINGEIYVLDTGKLFLLEEFGYEYHGKIPYYSKKDSKSYKRGL